MQLRLIFLLVAAILLAFTSAEAAEQQDSDSQLDAEVRSILAEVQEFVKENYPKAKISNTGTALHFEYKTKKEMGFYTDHPVLVPDQGGILGDVSLKSGTYEGQNKDRLPAEENEGFHTTLYMAPYAKSANKHLLAKL